MSTQPVSPNPQNRILKALPPSEYRRLSGSMERVRLEIRQTTGEAGKKLDFVYFPESAMISHVSRMQDGSSVEIGIAGREGMSGLPVLLGDGISMSESFAQISGEAARMTSRAFRREVTPDTALHGLLLRYTQVFIQQTGQSVACNRLHTIRERCAKWLLMTSDQIGETEFVLTQEFLSQMLGVRRPGVTEAAASLARNGLITYKRGRILILDLPGLREAACECYGIMRREVERVLASHA